MLAVGEKSEDVEAVVYRDIHHSPPRVSRAVELLFVRAAARETAAVDEHDDGRSLRAFRGVDVQHLTVLSVTECLPLPELAVIEAVFLVPKRAHLIAAGTGSGRVDVARRDGTGLAEPLRLGVGNAAEERAVIGHDARDIAYG